MDSESEMTPTSSPLLCFSDEETMDEKQMHSTIATNKVACDDGLYSADLNGNPTSEKEEEGISKPIIRKGGNNSNDSKKRLFNMLKRGKSNELVQLYDLSLQDNILLAKAASRTKYKGAAKIFHRMALWQGANALEKQDEASPLSPPASLRTNSFSSDSHYYQDQKNNSEGENFRGVDKSKENLSVDFHFQATENYESEAAIIQQRDENFADHEKYLSQTKRLGASKDGKQSKEQTQNEVKKKTTLLSIFKDHGKKDVSEEIGHDHEAHSYLNFEKFKDRTNIANNEVCRQNIVEQGKQRHQKKSFDKKSNSHQNDNSRKSTLRDNRVNLTLSMLTRKEKETELGNPSSASNFDALNASGDTEYFNSCMKMDSPRDIHDINNGSTILAMVQNLVSESPRIEYSNSDDDLPPPSPPSFFESTISSSAAHSGTRILSYAKQCTPLSTLSSVEPENTLAYNTSDTLVNNIQKLQNEKEGKEGQDVHGLRSKRKHARNESMEKSREIRDWIKERKSILRESQIMNEKMNDMYAFLSYIDPTLDWEDEALRDGSYFNKALKNSIKYVNALRIEKKKNEKQLKTLVNQFEEYILKSQRNNSRLSTLENECDMRGKIIAKQREEHAQTVKKLKSAYDMDLNRAKSEHDLTINKLGTEHTIQMNKLQTEVNKLKVLLNTKGYYEKQFIKTHDNVNNSILNGNDIAYVYVDKDKILSSVDKVATDSQATFRNNRENEGENKVLKELQHHQSINSDDLYLGQNLEKTQMELLTLKMEKEEVQAKCTKLQVQLERVLDLQNKQSDFNNYGNSRSENSNTSKDDINEISNTALVSLPTTGKRNQTESPIGSLILSSSVDIIDSASQVFAKDSCQSASLNDTSKTEDSASLLDDLSFTDPKIEKFSEMNKSSIDCHFDKKKSNLDFVSSLISSKVMERKADGQSSFLNDTSHRGLLYEDGRLVKKYNIYDSKNCADFSDIDKLCQQLQSQRNSFSEVVQNSIRIDKSSKSLEISEVENDVQTAGTIEAELPDHKNMLSGLNQQNEKSHRLSLPIIPEEEEKEDNEEYLLENQVKIEEGVDGKKDSSDSLTKDDKIRKEGEDIPLILKKPSRPAPPLPSAQSTTSFRAQSPYKQASMTAHELLLSSISNDVNIKELLNMMNS